jgi:hypothetical protein
LKVASRSSFSGLLHQAGTRPQRIRSKPRLPSRGTMTPTSWVGQTLVLAGQLRASSPISM